MADNLSDSPGRRFAVKDVKPGDLTKKPEKIIISEVFRWEKMTSEEVVNSLLKEITTTLDQKILTANTLEPVELNPENNFKWEDEDLQRQAAYEEANKAFQIFG